MKDEKNTDNFEENNPEELRFENELLKLKLQAEFGASPVVVKELPPEIENLFLKNIFQVERDFAERNTIKVFDKIGRPKLAKADELDDDAIEKAQIALEDLLLEKGVVVTFSDSETYRSKYVIITEKLFNVEVNNVDSRDTTIYFDFSVFDEEDDEEDD